MKKSIIKSLSVALALMLILASLPMAAFASNDRATTYALGFCQNGDHIYANVYDSVEYVDCGDYHRIDNIVVYECTACMYTYSENTGISHTEIHTHNRVAVGTNPATQETVYKDICICGNVKQ